jgi:flagellar motor switch protein fliN
MSATSFNEMEFDAIGEIMNISLGSSATAVSTLLGTKVNITTPIVQVLTKEDFDFQDLEPAVGVEISYVKGLSGKSVMLFSRNDVRVIVSMMMGAEIPEEEFVMDEINASAIREAMNQMMGASATALSEFLGTTVDISTPISYEIDDGNAFKDKYFDGSEDSVVIRFTLEIEGKLSSEFINIMSVDLVKRLLEPFKAQFGIEDDDDEYIPSEEPAAPVEAPQAEVQEAAPAESPAEVPQAAKSGPIDQAQADALLASLLQAQAEEGSAEAAQPASSDNAAPVENQPPKQEAQTPPVQPMPEAAPAQPIPQAAPAPPAIPQGMVMGGMMDPMTMQLITQMQQSQTQMMELMREMQSGRSSKAAPAEPSIIRPLNSKEFLDDAEGKEENASNRELLMKVPLEISVEIGRTRKLVKDILEFTQGSLVVLDKMAGEQADLYVNGECIAKGDIVVVEDNFGIRITEILKKDINEESL